MKTEVRARWRRTLLVCRKCSRKLGGGFGPDGDQTLAKLLRKRQGGGKARKISVGVVEVACLDICPKGAVVAIDAARPDRWLLVRAGTAIDEVAERLGLAPAVPG